MYIMTDNNLQPVWSNFFCYIGSENISCFKKIGFCLPFFKKKKSSSTLCYIPNIKPKKISLKCDLLQARFVIKASYQRLSMIHMRGRCHQWQCLPPLLQLWPPEWLGGRSAWSRGSAPAATRPPGFLTFATPTGKAGGWFRLHNEDVRTFMQRCGAGPKLRGS